MINHTPTIKSTTGNLWKKGVFILLGSAVLFLAGCQSSAPSNSAGSIAIAQNDIELGIIEMSKGTVDIPFTFRNDGTEPVILLEGETSCMCTTAYVKKGTETSPRLAMRGHEAVANINITILILIIWSHQILYHFCNIFQF